VISYTVDAVGSSKTSVGFLQTTWNYTPKGNVLYNHWWGPEILQNDNVLCPRNPHSKTKCWWTF